MRCCEGAVSSRSLDSLHFDGWMRRLALAVRAVNAL